MIKTIARGIAVAAVPALALAMGTAANAAPAAHPAALLPTVHFVADGEAGYEALYGNGISNIGATIVTNAPANDIGGVGTGGIGVQLCDPNNGFGAQLGEVETGTALKPSFSVEYQTGTLPDANGDNCAGNGVLLDPHVLGNLTGLAQGDSVELFTTFRNVRATVKTWHKGHWVPGYYVGSHWVRGHWVPGYLTTSRQEQGRVQFQAFDPSAFEIYTSPWIHTAADWAITSGAAGVSQDTTGMSADTPVEAAASFADVFTANDGVGVYTTGAFNDIADFSDVFVDGFALDAGSRGLGDTTPGAEQVVTTGGALPANTAIVAPNDSLEPISGSGASSFSVYAGEVLG